MECCQVCCEKINKINHKKVKCPFCDLTSCRACSQRYILSSFEDPHCMGCKTRWNREFIDSFCTMHFRNTELRKHRENVLFEREKALMPSTQPEVERILKIRKIKDKIRKEQEKFVHILQNGEITQIERVHVKIEELYRELARLRNMGEISIDNSRKFIRQCPLENCKGFLNEQWYCGLCDTQFCKKCSEKQHENHVCDPGVVETMTLLNKDSKPCPKCGIVIQKINGCSQMWCVECHTAFNWRTGEIINGRIHNPHFIEFKKKKLLSREHGDIPCGGTPTYRELREAGAPISILNYAITIHDLERSILFVQTEIPDNLNSRVLYMLNYIDEKMFKTFLQRQEKFIEKNRDVLNIYELLIHTGGDLLRQYVLNIDDFEEIIQTMKMLFRYGNDIFESLRKRYKCSLPKNISV